MANTTPVYARIDSDLKNKAEAILESQGITPAVLIAMAYSQIINSGEVSVSIRIPKNPVAKANLTEEQVKQMIMEGYYSSSNGDVHTLDEIKKVLKEQFNIDIS